MKRISKIALVLLAGATVSRMVRRKQKNVFPICAEFENAFYMNNGHFEIMQTSDSIIMRPYQR